MIYVRQTVEGQFAVALEALWIVLRSVRRRAVEFFVGFVAGMVAHGIDEAAATRNELQASLEQPRDQTMLEGLMEIADLPQLFFDVALLDFLGKRAQHFCRRVPSFQRVKNCLCGQ